MITTWTSAAGMEIRGEDLLLVCLRKGLQSISISGFKRILNIRQLPSLELKRQVNAFFKEKRIHKENVILGLPREQVLVRFLTFPVEVKANLAQVMKFQVENYEPSEENGFYYDFSIMGEGEESGGIKITVLLALIRKSVLDEYLLLFRDLQIPFRSVQVSTFALWKLLLQGMDRLKNTPYFLYNFGEKMVEVIGIQRKQPTYSGIVLLKEGEPFHAATLLETLEHGLSAAGQQTEIVEGIFFAGREAENRRRGIAAEIPEVGLLTTHLKLHSPASLAPELPDLAIPIGLALDVFQGKSLPTLNLLPEDKRPRKNPYALVPTYILLAALLLLGSAYFGRQLLQEYLYVQELDREIAGLKPQVDEVEAIRKQNQQLENKIEYLEKMFCAQDNLLEMLAEMTGMFPDDTYLIFLNDREGEVVIQGFSQSASQLMPLISKSNYLKSPEHQSPITRDPITNKERFFIKARLEGKECN